MNIGVYGYSPQSAFDIFIGIARERQVHLEDYIQLPQEEELPDVMVINPSPIKDEVYYQRMRGCIENHPQTKFMIVAESSSLKGYVEKGIGGDHENVEYLVLRNSVAKLKALLDEA